MSIFNFSSYFENDDKKYIKAIEKIKKECSNIIQLYKATDRFFYRGIEGDLLIGKKNIPPKNRKPVNTRKVDHDFIDKELYDKFKWHPRSEGVFVTTSKDTASVYGNAYIFFPSDGFKYIWNPYIHDLWAEVTWSGTYREKYINRYNPNKGRGFWKRGDETIDDIKNLHGYRSHDIKLEMDDIWEKEGKAKNEWKASVKIEHSNEEIIERWTWIPKMDFNQFRHTIMKEVLKNYTDKNISKAIHMNNEISFKCEYYYILPPDILTTHKKEIL